MNVLNRNMFRNRDSRNRLAQMGGILSSSPELQETAMTFANGGGADLDTKFILTNIPELGIREGQFVKISAKTLEGLNNAIPEVMARHGDKVKSVELMMDERNSALVALAREGDDLIGTRVNRLLEQRATDSAAAPDLAPVPIPPAIAEISSPTASTQDNLASINGVDIETVRRIRDSDAKRSEAALIESLAPNNAQGQPGGILGARYPEGRGSYSTSIAEALLNNDPFSGELSPSQTARNQETLRNTLRREEIAQQRADSIEAGRIMRDAADTREAFSVPLEEPASLRENIRKQLAGTYSKNLAGGTGESSLETLIRESIPASQTEEISGDPYAGDIFSDDRIRFRPRENIGGGIEAQDAANFEKIKAAQQERGDPYAGDIVVDDRVRFRPRENIGGGIEAQDAANFALESGIAKAVPTSGGRDFDLENEELARIRQSPLFKARQPMTDVERYGSEELQAVTAFPQDPEQRATDLRNLRIANQALSPEELKAALDSGAGDLTLEAAEKIDPGVTGSVSFNPKLVPSSLLGEETKKQRLENIQERLDKRTKGTLDEIEAVLKTAKNASAVEPEAVETVVETAEPEAVETVVETAEPQVLPKQPASKPGMGSDSTETNTSETLLEEIKRTSGPLDDPETKIPQVPKVSETVVEKITTLGEKSGMGKKFGGDGSIADLTKDYTKLLKSLLGESDEDKAARKGELFMLMGAALMSGKSSNALTNIGGALQIGAKAAIQDRVTRKKRDDTIGLKGFEMAADRIAKREATADKIAAENRAFTKDKLLLVERLKNSKDLAEFNSLLGNTYIKSGPYKSLLSEYKQARETFDDLGADISKEDRELGFANYFTKRMLQSGYDPLDIQTFNLYQGRSSLPSGTDGGGGQKRSLTDIKKTGG